MHCIVFFLLLLLLMTTIGLRLPPLLPLLQSEISQVFYGRNLQLERNLTKDDVGYDLFVYDIYYF